MLQMTILRGIASAADFVQSCENREQYCVRLVLLCKADAANYWSRNLEYCIGLKLDEIKQAIQPLMVQASITIIPSSMYVTLIYVHYVTIAIRASLYQGKQMNTYIFLLM